MAELQEFMFLFRYSPNLEHTPTKEELAQQEKDWGAFIGKMAAQAKLVNVYQLDVQGVVQHSDLSEPAQMYVAENMAVGGTMVVKATDIAEAVTLSKLCPIFKIGGSVEIHPIIPM
ncbi:YciI family protein [Ochrovirga pacifica]|uniref:YciI family protein n=1 Tax=Ochrovirga pacifica TaxID=1042376 RepID=UPI00025597FF|nr:hypothetical protein [Ochrovirga pacifica]